MALDVPPTFILSNECPVKWTAAQERSISRDYPLTDCGTWGTDASGKADARRTYMQFLWLPESIMSLHYFVPAILRSYPLSSISDTSFSAAVAISSADLTSIPSSRTPCHPLHAVLRPLLLTPRAVSQRYHTHISQLIESDGAEGTAGGHRNINEDEEGMVWFAYKNAKEDEELVTQTQTQVGNGGVAGDDAVRALTFEAEEAWTARWLQRMEQREVQIQILLHILMLALPGTCAHLPAEEPHPELPVHLSPSNKRKRRREKEKEPELPLEECLELFMDKLSMWQLMASLDAQDAARDPQVMQGKGKGKEKIMDERDWMQVFCEDVVELRFKAALPEICKLLRSKVFQGSPFEDDPDSPTSSPLASPRLAPKRVKSTCTTVPQSQRVAPGSASAPSELRSSRLHTKVKDASDAGLQRARSRSLSLSLQQDCTRSRSASTAVGGAKRKSAISREVSMNTTFRQRAQKAQERQREHEQAKATAAVQKASGTGKVPARADGTKSVGVTLVASTPVKPKERKEKAGQNQPALMQKQTQTPLPKCDLHGL